MFDTVKALMSRCWYWFMQHICWLVALLAFRVRILGAEHIPQTGSLLVVSNHQSFLDPALVGLASRRKLRFLARKTLFVWPLSWLMRSLGALPVDQQGSGIAGVRATLKILKNEDGLVLFPEGTRSKNGKLQPLKPGFCAIAKRSSATILPMGIAGAFAALPPGRRIPRFKPIAIQFGEPIPPAEAKPLSDDELLQLVAERIADAQRLAAERVGC